MREERGLLWYEDLQSGAEWVIDAATGVVHSHYWMNEETGNGLIVMTRDLTLFPGDVWAPAFDMRIKVINGKPQTVEVVSIVKAEFNVDLADEEFVLPAKKSTVMVSYMNEYKDADRLTQDVSDTTDYFLAKKVEVPTEPVLEQVAQKEPVRRSYFSLREYLLILNGIFLMGLGYIYWNRSRR